MPQHWVDVQREQFKRLGIIGDWDDPYLTMDFEAEATIVEELMKFAESGQLYRGAKPVMWSRSRRPRWPRPRSNMRTSSRPRSTSRSRSSKARSPNWSARRRSIWTTTPWTIPVNQAIAYGPEIDYVLVIPSWRGIRANGRKVLIASESLLDGLRFDRIPTACRATEARST